MQAKKAGPRFLFAVFIAVICCPWIFWFFLQGCIDTTNYENRELQEAPGIRDFEDYTSFPRKFEAFFNDRIPFRNALVMLKGAADYYAFGTSPNKKVIIGKDGWLFFDHPADGNPMAGYRGYTLTEEEVKAFAEHCIRQRDRLAEEGIDFVIFIAPNKARIYSDKMPDSIGPPAENYEVKQIVNYLRENTDLKVFYPIEELKRAREILPQDIYYKTDTHWNRIGGYVGTKVLLEALGINMPDWETGEVTVFEDGERTGDLARLLGLFPGLQRENTEYTVGGYDTHEVESLGDFEYEYRFRAKGADPRKIFVIWDSFSESMRPYLASQFNESEFVYYPHYSYALLEEQKPDIVIFEVVERYWRNISYFEADE